MVICSNQSPARSASAPHPSGIVRGQTGILADPIEEIVQRSIPSRLRP